MAVVYVFSKETDVQTLKQFKTLQRMVDDIFAESQERGLSLPRLAARAGLSSATVYRLWNYDTMFPRTQTVALLARAVGYKVVLHKPAARLKVVG